MGVGGLTSSDWLVPMGDVSIVSEIDILRRIARETGGATAEVNRRLERVERDWSDARERLRIAEVGPRATAKLMLWLPFGAVALSQLLGVDVLGALHQTLGAASFAAGLGLLWLARRWMRSMIGSASGALPDSALPFELMAVALSSGESVARALNLVESQLTAAEWPTDPDVGARLHGLAEASSRNRPIHGQCASPGGR